MKAGTSHSRARRTDSGGSKERCGGRNRSPRGLSPAQLAGGFGLPDALPLSSRIEEKFLRLLAALPEETQRLLMVAAAEPAGDPRLLWRAAGRLGIGSAALAPAETAGLLNVGARVGFRHPLVRSAVYRAASASERQAVHAALAEATDPDTDGDRRAWHRAQAAPFPDEEVAAELERSADRAQGRGGVAAAAAFLARSADMTLDPGTRAERTVAAARLNVEAGAFAAARARCWRLPKRALSTSSRARPWICCAGGWRPVNVGAGMLRRCCSGPRSAWSESTYRWR